ncbi:hypothetical protein ACTXT7_012017, partial [Hymenolepis weldensis]
MFKQTNNLMTILYFGSRLDRAVVSLSDNSPLIHTPNKKDIRHTLLFELHQGNTSSSVAAAKTLKHTYGNDAVNEKTCR